MNTLTTYFLKSLARYFAFKAFEKLDKKGVKLSDITPEHLDDIITEEDLLSPLPGTPSPALDTPSVEVSETTGDGSFIEDIYWTHRYINSKWDGEENFQRMLTKTPITLRNVKANKKQAWFEPAMKGSFHFFAIKEGDKNWICDKQAHSSHHVSDPWSKNFYGKYSHILVVQNDPKTNKILGRSLVTAV